MNVDVDAGFEKMLSDSLKAQREVTEIDGKKYKAPYELPTALIGKVRYRRAHWANNVGALLASSVQTSE